MGVRPNASQFRVLKKLIILTHPTPAATSPARPESAEAASSPRDAPHPGKAAGESKPEAYPFSPTRPRSAKTPRFPSEYVEDFDEPRTTLRSFFSALLCR
jgi:hypothetical protein